MLGLFMGMALAAGADPSTKIVPRTAEQLALVSEAERIGRDLYDFDQAAWGATDAMVATMPDPGAAGVRGWIVEREAAGTVATFYGMKADLPYKIFVAHMNGRTVIASHRMGPGEPTEMSTIERRMVEARRVALSPETIRKIDFRPCTSGSINSVVLEPADAGAPVPVYLLTPQPSMESYPLGGHYRVDVAANGTIVRSRAFAKSCLTMDRRQPDTAVMFVTTHLLDPQPTEIHAWTSLVAPVPLGIVIVGSGDFWIIDKGKIRYESTLLERTPTKP